MSKEKTRKDKTCLNCFQVVDKKYCSNCGQENTETRHTFHHLFTHFAEDLVHYDGAFWKTIKGLLFKPALLTKTYLSGRRKIYVPPVKLYIFINFLTFFLLGVLPSGSDDALNDTDKKSIIKISNESKLAAPEYKSVRAFDSIQKSLPESKKLHSINRWMNRRYTEICEKNAPEAFQEKFVESFVHNLPKVLFLYMPFFAFGLWLFHGKKRWLYFDHGIFTLHYFSFILLTLSGFLILSSITDYLNDAFNTLTLIALLLMMLWWFFYFFRSHRLFYEESKFISRGKGFALFFINMVFIIVFLILAMLYTALNIH